ncbi:MAG: glycosyltransferase family 2 protein [Oscillospiraceae bacterium]|nr:glycosyltransferase family 2 protein [Oscillospiraceae bacterium]
MYEDANICTKRKGRFLLKASLCIVTYNNKNNISAALGSILEKTKGAELQIYICDNASTDGTPDMVERDFPQVKVIRGSENRGFGAGHNTIINMLDSDIHFIVNPDIMLTEDTVTQMCGFMNDNPDIVMAVPKFIYENGEEQFTPKLTPTLRYMLGGRLERFGGVFRRWRREYTFADRNITEVTDVGFCSGCFIVIRTDVFKKLGGFDERYFLYSEDADLTRMAQEYGRTVYAPQFSVVHLWERAYMKSKKYFLIQLSSMFKYFWKWRSGRKSAKG